MIFSKGSIKIQLILEQQGLNFAGPLIHRFFKIKYTVSPLYLQVSHPQIQPRTKNSIFNPLLGIHRHYMYCCMLFSITDLSIDGFGYPLGGSETNPSQIPRDDCS